MGWGDFQGWGGTAPSGADAAVYVPPAVPGVNEVTAPPGLAGDTSDESGESGKSDESDESDGGEWEW